ncbi:MAG: hypothetical protein VX438_19470, partial [Planctomycetota bacterium]|nr:hypothetical protein [Planctomycetota bacterium]
TIFSLAICLLSGLANGQDENKKKKGQKRGGKQIASRMMARFKNANLTDEQKSKMARIIKEHSGALQELQKATNTLLSPEIRKARNEARKKAQGEGLKGKELQAAVEKAAAIPAGDVEKLKEIQKKSAAKQKEIVEALTALLTPEQKAKLPKRGGGKKPAKGKNKKDNQ